MSHTIPAYASAGGGSPYFEQCPDGHWQVAGSRVSLDSIVYAYQEGESPEQIVRAFPGLSAEQVYGAITFYLANRDNIDDYLSQQADRWDRLRDEAARRNAGLRTQILSRSGTMS